jgi:hypothetical protein
MRGKILVILAGSIFWASPVLAQEATPPGRPAAAPAAARPSGNAQRSNVTLPEDPRGTNGFGLLYSYSEDLHHGDLYQGMNGAYDGGYAYPRN